MLVWNTVVLLYYPCLIVRDFCPVLGFFKTIRLFMFIPRGKDQFTSSALMNVKTSVPRLKNVIDVPHQWHRIIGISLAFNRDFSIMTVSHFDCTKHESWFHYKAFQWKKFSSVFSSFTFCRVFSSFYVSMCYNCYTLPIVSTSTPSPLTHRVLNLNYRPITNL